MPDRKLKAAKAAFDTSIDGGITFFDTAEVYGAGVGRNSLMLLLSHARNLNFLNKSNFTDA